MASKEIIQEIADELKAIISIKEQNGDTISESEISYIVGLLMDVRHKAGKTLTEYGRQSLQAMRS